MRLLGYIFAAMLIVWSIGSMIAVVVIYANAVTMGTADSFPVLLFAGLTLIGGGIGAAIYAS